MGFLFFKSKLTSLSLSGILKGAADCHSHILPGVDDGFGTMEEALKALDFEEKCGVSDIWCTPHVMEDVPNTTEALQERFACLKASYSGSATIHLGAEYMIDNILVDRIHSGDLLFTGNAMQPMFETRAMNEPLQLKPVMTRSSIAGYTPVLAHPERYLYMEMDDYATLLDSGVIFQLNLGSLLGAYGPQVRERAQILLKEGAYSRFGTDAHNLRTIQSIYTEEAFDTKTIESLEKISRI